MTRKVRTEHDKQQRRRTQRATYERLVASGSCPRCKGPLDRTDRKRCAACRRQSRTTACQRRLREGCFPAGLYREHRLDCVSLNVTKDERPGAFTVTAIYLEPENQRGQGPGRLFMSGLKLEQLRGVLGLCRLLEPADRARLLPPLAVEAMGAGQPNPSVPSDRAPSDHIRRIYRNDSLSVS